MNENKAKQFFHDHIIDLVIIFICIAYLGADLIRITTTGKTMEEVLWDGGLAMMISYGISQAMGLKGISSGERSKKVVATDSLLGEKIAEAETKILYMDEWCEEKTRATLMQRRRTILAKAGIHYAEVFDKNGNILPYKIEDTIKSIRKKKEAAIKEALDVHITTLTTAWLMANDTDEADPYNHSKTKGRFLTRRALLDLLTKGIVLVGVGFFVVEELKEFDMAKIIWCSIQLATYLFMGTMSYMRSYTFVTDELRGQKIKRINLLIEYFADYPEYEARANRKKEKRQTENNQGDNEYGEKIYV